MGRVDKIADGLEAIWTYFRGKPDLVVPRRVPPTTRPRPDPDLDPAPKPPPHRPPFMPRLRDPETETQPEGQTEGETTTTTEDMQEWEICPDCEPRKQGHASWRTLTGTDAAKPSGAQYQNWVIPWFRWVGNQIEEWEFQAVKFDGIDQTICQVIEAKGKYGLYFRNPNGLRIDPHDYAERGPLQKDVAEFRRQYAKIARYDPQATLHWVMHTWAYYMYMSPIIQGAGYLATAEHWPYAGWNVND